ncbi:MAG: exosome complex RNA-binding protein Rrp4 [Halobacteriaceae archaeon]
MMHVEKRELVVPGQLIAEGEEYTLGEGVFREGNEIRASQMGLADEHDNRIRTISLEGRYIPKEGDRVLGVVIDDYYAGWVLNIDAPYEGNLSVSAYKGGARDKEDLDVELNNGDLVEAKVQNVDELMNVQLEVTEQQRGKITGGRMVEISPSKIPRVIGRRGSMVSTLHKGGNCSLSVGQNGRIVIWGDDQNVDRVVEAIYKIEREAHTSGLTDRIKEFLQKESKGG